MALILKKLIKGYFYLYEEKRDVRLDNYFLMSSPLHPIMIGLGYLLLIYKILPEYMKDRPPFKLDKILVTFNLIQVIVNSYIAYHAFLELFNLNMTCSPVDYTDTPRNRFIVNVTYTYFLTKVADLLDTIFFVLRGKTKQVSFLHVYHHFGMIGLSWVGTRFLAGGHSIFLGCVNSLVHVIMYFYYFLTIWKPEYKNNFWWKKHITQLQLIQFVLFFFFYGQLLFRPDCPYPKFVSYFIVPQSIFMMTMFGDFYWQSYVKPKRAKNE